MNNKAIFQLSDAFPACDTLNSFLKKNQFSPTQQSSAGTTDCGTQSEECQMLAHWFVSKTRFSETKRGGRVGLENVTNKSVRPTLDKHFSTHMFYPSLTSTKYNWTASLEFYMIYRQVRQKYKINRICQQNFHVMKIIFKFDQCLFLIGNIFVSSIIRWTLISSCHSISIICKTL